MCMQIVDKLKTMTLLEAAELVKEIETTFGVDARCVQEVGTGTRRAMEAVVRRRG